jgi:hypothetical protein
MVTRVVGAIGRRHDRMCAPAGDVVSDVDRVESPIRIGKHVGNRQAGRVSLVRHTVDADEADIGLGAATLRAIRRAVGAWPRRWLVAITLLAGLSAAVALGTTMPPADRTFAALSNPVQSMMSVTAPFVGVLLACDLMHTRRAARVTPTLLAVALLAAGVGVFGVVVCAATLAVDASGAAEEPWRHAVTIAVGSVLVQVVAQLVGTGLGLLLRPAVVAFLASIVLPLGLWAVLGSVGVLRATRAWLTP